MPSGRLLICGACCKIELSTKKPDSAASFCALEVSSSHSACLENQSSYLGGYPVGACTRLTYKDYYLSWRAENLSPDNGITSTTADLLQSADPLCMLSQIDVLGQFQEDQSVMILFRHCKSEEVLRKREQVRLTRFDLYMYRDS